jgi:putative oxidoreductase
MLRKLVQTPHDAVATIARLALGVVMLPHGAQKALGLFGGPGLQGTVGFMGSMGIPALFAILAIAAEFLGAIGLITGLLGRVAALGIAVVMLVAVGMSHLQTGFFMNWTGQQKGEGFEYHLLAIGLAAVVMVRGSGAWSVDRALSLAGLRSQNTQVA